MGLLRPGMHIHLIGIGGAGLSAIARVLHGWGYRVSGSDRQASALTEALAAEGIAVSIGHRAGQAAGADLVVVSSAIPADNPEVVEARQRGLPVVKRERFLADLTANKRVLAVAGTHGKTTTTAMIAWILLQAGLDPTFIVGGVLQNLGTNARAGDGPYFVIEADEYDRAFLGLRPTVAVITALEHDHPDCYPTFAQMRQAFVAFVGQVVAEGRLILCGEAEEARRLGEAVDRPAETYGLDPAWDWWASGEELGRSSTFAVWRGDRRLGDCALQLPGRHNVLNALAALATSAQAGVAFDVAAAALTRFRGTERRFEVKGQAAGVVVVDDYAHHPTEVRATLAAARLKYPGRRIWAVFQPHTYSRTAALLDDFARAFDEADRVIVTPIYAAREAAMPGVTGAVLAARLEHPDVRAVGSLTEASEMLRREVEPGDLVITLGAGDGYRIGEELLARLEG
ncbi:MAG TPA: UDP-N-acetylmuramate--L-alanine ligase [Anaerolineae bacterium]|nr:UDP-N-acetylmuramate--L-alanine ligase [Anaerolineae bacterium]